MIRSPRQADSAGNLLERSFRALVLALPLTTLGPAALLGADGGVRFDEQVLPVLEDHCYSCHANGIKKGGLDLEALVASGAKPTERDREIWYDVLRNVRSGMMPPADSAERPTAAEGKRLADWIKFGALGIDPADPDPGRVTLRRLNRIEYRNTIRDLVGIDFDTTAEFPPDDTGHGFDNIGDVLSLSPLLLEKYLAASKAIIARAVPAVPRVAAERTIAGKRFHRAGAKPGEGGGPLILSYYEPALVSTTQPIDVAGRYQVVLDYLAGEKYVDGINDYNKCRLVFKVDGQELLRREFVRQGGMAFRVEADRDWEPGPHEFTIEVEPLTPGVDQVRSLSIRVQGLTIRGPMDPRHFVPPPNYDRAFPDGGVPAAAEARPRYARALLTRFASRAFRRPVDPASVDRLAALAEDLASAEGQTWEAGIGHAMAAILTSPRFLFREEDAEANPSGPFALVDEYGLASRLSYFFWSTMPDDELIRLAGEHQLRANLAQQVERLLADPRSNEFVRNFVGQWLQARDVDTVLINADAVLARDEVPDPNAGRKRSRFRELNRKPAAMLTDAEKAELKEARASFRRFRDLELTSDLRTAMRRETEMSFEHVVRGDRSLLELLNADYTFLNEGLAKHYGIDGVTGDTMRRVALPPDSPRGGILTQGTVLTVTSNPDRTSPVKRGLFLLDNILGVPPAPPPPNIPSLEEAGKRAEGKVLTLRESMKLHQSNASCASCHARMDPLGLALENFNALGRWRDKERTDPIDPAGRLATGEAFRNIRELKRTLANDRRRDYYRCLTEKLLTYALGRGLGPTDVQAVDTIIERIEASEGRSSALIAGIVESAPFQKRRRVVAEGASAPSVPGDEPSDRPTED